MRYRILSGLMLELFSPRCQTFGAFDVFARDGFNQPKYYSLFRKVNLTINTSGNKNDTYITAAVAKIYFLCLSVCGFVINKLISIRNQIKILFALGYLYIDVDRQ